MFVASKLFGDVFRVSYKYFHSLTTVLTIGRPGGLYDTFVRHNVRNHFPRPNERQRVKRHGWKKRMSMAGGQRIIMNKMLKGKHVYSH
ncbi:hypothetical protein FQA39_LY17388 [Lamprigera yunnana]|nr:hypothetical protein FQA39_LY17388 [Lamprigera yunnana]